MAADAAGVAVAMIAGQLADHAIRSDHDLAGVFASVCYVPIFVVVLGLYGLYHRAQRRLVSSSFPDIGRIVHGMAAGSLVALFASGGIHRWLQGPTVDRTAAAIAAVIGLVAIPTSRKAVSMVARPSSSHSNVLVVGSGQVAEMVLSRLARLDDLTVVGCADDSADEHSDYSCSVPWLGPLGNLAGIVDRFNVDHVVVAFSAANEAGMAAHLRDLPDYVRISVVPRMFDLLTIRSNVDDLRGLPVIDVAPASLGFVDRFVKRAIDVIGAASGLLILSPLLIVISIAVKASSEGPVLFSQTRAGRGGRPFRIHKFRTMYLDADRRKAELSSEVDGPLFKIKEDPRVTPIGRLLRKSSLDEIPQLLNVLVGEMSLVGPRPFVLVESGQIEGWAARRFDVRPGMTGLWQTSGRNDLPFEELRRLDYLYVASWSLWWDLSILWHTPARVFRQDGAY
jgi:exopolysaccharide biosynthesis polyprenyl glycosylphosphotransferase